MYFDTHAHLNFSVFLKNRDRLIEKCLKDNVSFINVGINFSTSQKAVEIAQSYNKGVYAAVGLHPMNLDTGLTKIKTDKREDKQDSLLEQEFDYQKYKKLAQNKKVIAIGEIGLDYYWKPKTKKRFDDFRLRQEFLFLEEAKLAIGLNLPIIIHCRMAHEDLLLILRKLSAIYDKNLRGVIHCFTGNMDQAKEYMRLGFLIGLNGIIFKLNLKEIIREIPLDNILLETDCPYLSPPNYNQNRNDPLGVKFVAKEIARIKKLPLKEVVDQTTKNAQKLFLSINY